MKKKDKYNVAVVGVGAVGVEMLRCLRQRDFPVGELRVFARSQREIEIDDQIYKVESISPEKFDCIDIALFAGTEGEKGAAVMYAPEAVKKGAVVIDNGRDFRLKPNVPLVVPEVNAEKVKEHKGIISNPNCTTIQMVTALNQIHKQFGLEQIILSSYQAASGAGKKAAVDLWKAAETLVLRNKDKDFDLIEKVVDKEPQAHAAQLIFNVIPQIGGFSDYGYTSEEWKTVNEAHKIFDDDTIKVATTCVRVPVFTSHSESIYLRTKRKADISDMQKALESSRGVTFYKDPQKSVFPLDAEGKDDVFVGRLRKDPFNPNSFWLWCVGDNLRKGAALNAVQIAETLIQGR